MSPDPQRPANREITVIVPDQPPMLTPLAARALLRLITRAAEKQRTTEPNSEDPSA